MAKTYMYDTLASMDGVKMIQFGDYQLPVHYGDGIIAEHQRVRSAVGLFDVSHMGRCILEGEDSEEFLNYLVTNDITALQNGQILYTLMCYPDGTTVDDLIIYRLGEKSFYLVINAANREKDISWILGGNPRGFDAERMTFTDLSDTTCQFALQGRNAVSLLEALGVHVADIPPFHFITDTALLSREIMISRNGYTGEDGFELYIQNEGAHELWNLLIEKGKEFSLTPCGLGARDTLRIEARLPLYGHELSDEITPLEANLSVFVKFDKNDFCGKEALLDMKQSGIPRTLRGIVMIDPSVPRNGCRVFLGDEEIGYVTSGTKSPTLNLFVGFILIRRDPPLQFEDVVEIEIHGKRKRAKIVRTPFYRKESAH